MVGPAGESKSEQGIEQETEQDEGTYVWFQPEIAPKSEDDDEDED